MSVPSYKRDISHTQYLQQYIKIESCIETYLIKLPQKNLALYHTPIVQTSMNIYSCLTFAEDYRQKLDQNKQHYTYTIEFLQKAKKYIYVLQHSIELCNRTYFRRVVQTAKEEDKDRFRKIYQKLMKSQGNIQEQIQQQKKRIDEVINKTRQIAKKKYIDI